MKVGVVDYGIGNIKSVLNALIYLDIDCLLTHDPKEIESCDALILPGVGAFKTGMTNLVKFNLIEHILDFAEQGKPILGICLGMQLLFDYSTEGGEVKGLGLIKGKVQKFPVTIGEKIPTVAWKSLKTKTNPLFEGINSEDEYYFVHSYYCKPYNDNHTIAYAGFGEMQYCAMVQSKNIFGTQFHPEKSRESGLNIIMNFLKYSYEK